MSNGQRPWDLAAPVGERDDRSRSASVSIQRASGVGVLLDVVEKLMRQGPRVGRLAGALLIIWGAYVLASGG